MTAKIKKFSNGMAGIPLPSSTAEKFLSRGVKRVVCIINGKYELHAAILKLKEQPYYLTTSKRVMKELDINIGSAIQFTIQDDKTPLQFEQPEEWREVINTDPEAKQIFEGLTEGNQRGLISLVLMVKSSQKRIDRALLITDKLKRGVTSPRLMMK